LKTFAITLACAFAIHGGLAVGVVVGGASHGSSSRAVMRGEPIDIVDDRRFDDIHTEQVATDKSNKQESPRAAANARVIARPSSTQTTATDDVVPEPQPTQSVPARFHMSLGPQIASSDLAPAQAASDEVVSDTEVTERARKIGGSAPVYPAEAIDRGIELESPLPFEVIVDTQGRVEQARLLAHAGHGFDEAAITAVRTFRFSPAMRNGHAVRVRMHWTVDFRFGS